MSSLRFGVAVLWMGIGIAFAVCLGVGCQSVEPKKDSAAKDTTKAAPLPTPPGPPQPKGESVAKGTTVTTAAAQAQATSCEADCKKGEITITLSMWNKDLSDDDVKQIREEFSKAFNGPGAPAKLRFKYCKCTVRFVLNIRSGLPPARRGEHTLRKFPPASESQRKNGGGVNVGGSAPQEDKGPRHNYMGKYHGSAATGSRV